MLRLAAAEAAAKRAEEAARARIGPVKVELDNLVRELRLGAAVVTAAGKLGLVPGGSRGLLSRRELSWPISVLARPEPPVPSMKARPA